VIDQERRSIRIIATKFPEGSNIKLIAGVAKIIFLEWTCPIPNENV
jgi:hypothetical protein